MFLHFHPMIYIILVREIKAIKSEKKLTLYDDKMCDRISIRKSI